MIFTKGIDTGAAYQKDLSATAILILQDRHVCRSYSLSIPILNVFGNRRLVMSKLRDYQQQVKQKLYDLPIFCYIRQETGGTKELGVGNSSTFLTARGENIKGSVKKISALVLELSLEVCCG